MTHVYGNQLKSGKYSVWSYLREVRSNILQGHLVRLTQSRGLTGTEDRDLGRSGLGALPWGGLGLGPALWGRTMSGSSAGAT